MANATQLSRRFVFCPVFVCFLGALLFAGCEKPADAPKSQPTVTTNSAPPPAPKVVASPNPDEKVCIECKGQGTVACSAPGCVNGQVDCPAPCVKLNKGVWVKRPGRPDPNETMQLLVISGRQVWVSSHHPGVTYVSRADGGWNMITCPVCNGKAKVNCPVCKGTGKQTCPVCNGKKFVPVAWTPTNNPWFNSQPDLIRLKDGRVLLGRVAMAIGEERTIITRDKQTLHLKASDILPQANTNAPAAKTSSTK
jgi:hypothetical protein